MRAAVGGALSSRRPWAQQRTSARARRIGTTPSPQAADAATLRGGGDDAGGADRSRSASRSRSAPRAPPCSRSSACPRRCDRRRGGRQAGAGMGLRGAAEDLLVRRGVMFRRMSVIPYGRMQYVEVTAGPFERAFGLATVQMHTAAAASDARIPGLRRGRGGTPARPADLARRDARDGAVSDTEPSSAPPPDRPCHRRDPHARPGLGGELAAAASALAAGEDRPRRARDRRGAADPRGSRRQAGIAGRRPRCTSACSWWCSCSG